MRTITIAGGTGLLGRLATNHFLNQGWRVNILSRQPQASPNTNLRYILWTGKQLAAWAEVLEQSQVLLNLSGRTVDCRYTPENRRQIMASRLGSTRALALAMQRAKNPPKLWINASSATYYTHAYTPQTEREGRAGTGFSVEVCRRWEGEFFSAPLTGTRKVALRLGIVLSRSEGALQPLKRLAHLGVSRLGPGSQYLSWLHQTDYLRALDFLIGQEGLDGVVNLSSPQPCTNRNFMQALRRAVSHLPIRMPLPKPLLELGARLIQTETELILKSRYVVPERLVEAGFKFCFESIKEALDDLIRPNAGRDFHLNQISHV